MNSLFINLALGLLLPEIAAAAGTVDEGAVIAKVNGRIKGVFHDASIEPTVEGLVDATIDMALFAVRDAADIKDLVEKAGAQDWTGALAELKTLVVKALPSVPDSLAKAEIAAVLAA